MIGVVKVGSALFDEPENINLENLKTFIGKFKGDLVFVTGGGRDLKAAINKYDRFKLPAGFIDHLIMESTHINAKALSRILKGTYCRSFPDVEANLKRKPVTAGQINGQTTDASAAELADYLGADVLILTKDVGGIYTVDPKENPGARILHKLSFEDLKQFIKTDTSPGNYGILDPQAINLIRRSRIKTYVVGMDFDFDRGTEIA